MLIILVAIGAAHALYLTFLVFDKKNKRWPDYVLATYLVTLAVTFASAFISVEYEMPELMVIHLNINLLLAPLFFVYLQSLIEHRKQKRTSLFVHLIPYLLTWGYWLFLFGTQSESDLDVLFSGADIAQPPLLFRGAILLEVLAIPVYVCWSLWILKKHNHAISQSFSFTEGIDLKWANALLLCTGVIWLSMVITDILRGDMKWMIDDRTVMIGYASATFFIYYLGYFGLRQGHIGGFGTSVHSALHLGQGPYEGEPKAKYLKSGLEEGEARVFAEKLIGFVERERPYLQNRLSIQELALSVGIPSRHISQVINDHMGQTFYDFINRYRIQEFKRRVENQEYKTYTLISIALDCGFNSKSSFNRVFKKFEGCTPSQYMQAIAGQG